MQKTPNPLVEQFIRDCEALGVPPEDLLASVGIHRSVWFRWKAGTFAPSMKNWQRATGALEARRLSSTLARSAA